MKRKSEEIKTKDEKTGLEKEERPKKEFKIEIVKVGKLEEKTAGNGCNQYDCVPM